MGVEVVDQPLIEFLSDGLVLTGLADQSYDLCQSVEMALSVACSGGMAHQIS